MRRHYGKCFESNVSAATWRDPRYYFRYFGAGPRLISGFVASCPAIIYTLYSPACRAGARARARSQKSYRAANAEILNLPPPQIIEAQAQQNEAISRRREENLFLCLSLSLAGPAAGARARAREAL